jgi:hypothetical protein
MPNFLHEIVLKRESQQELHDWQSSISHAIAQQDLADPWEPALLNSAEQNVHYSGGAF